MVVISHFKLYSALFPLKWLICIPNMSAVRGNAVFETLHDFYRTAIIFNKTICITEKHNLKNCIEVLEVMLVLYLEAFFFSLHTTFQTKGLQFGISDGDTLGFIVDIEQTYFRFINRKQKESNSRLSLLHHLFFPFL